MLTDEHRKRRVEFAKNVVKWFGFCLPWVFSDESMIVRNPEKKKLISWTFTCPAQSLRPNARERCSTQCNSKVSTHELHDDHRAEIAQRKWDDSAPDSTGRPSLVTDRTIRFIDNNWVADASISDEDMMRLVNQIFSHLCQQDHDHKVSQPPEIRVHTTQDAPTAHGWAERAAGYLLWLGCQPHIWSEKLAIYRWEAFSQGPG